MFAFVSDNKYHWFIAEIDLRFTIVPVYTIW